MIGYRISDANLEAAIIAHNAGWSLRAAIATKACRDAGKFVDQGSIWSDIKEVYIRLQHEKCCYCERRLASERFGKVEHDVEHFRPKARLQDWFSEDILADFPDWPATLSRSGAKDTGYFKLGYDPRNYATSCKTCNSALKRDLFPVLGTVRTVGTSPASLASEKPLLIFPLGEWDELPESLIRFEGITALPVHAASADLIRHWRARVTIRFFRLNRNASDATPNNEEGGRENIYRERAEVISSLAKSLDALERAIDNPRIRTRHENDIKLLTSAQSPHTNCCRSFLKLWTDDKRAATDLWLDAGNYLDSQGLKA